MIHELVLVTALGVTTIGAFTDEADCQYAAEEWKAQKIAAGCVPVRDHDEAIKTMFEVMGDMKARFDFERKQQYKENAK